jgi:hypothetical protein
MIYIYAPHKFSSGGPELLHQLAYILKNKYKKNVKMYYLPTTKTNPIHKDFIKLNIKFTKKIIDKKKNTLIIPEVYSNLNHSLRYKNIKKVIWWLSVNNYLNSKFRSENNRFSRFFIKIPYFIIYFFNRITSYYFGIFTIADFIFNYYIQKNLNNSPELKQAKFHLAQSDYALNFIKKKFSSFKVFLLKDFQKDIFLDEYKNYKKNIKLKKNIVTYNGTKSNDFMNSIINYNKHIKFIPLINLTPKEVKNTLLKSKIYMDFGFHPGMDRPPREAVLLGNCIITNLKGSAKHFKDVPLPANFKFKEETKNLNKIKKLINLIFLDYAKYEKKFKKYRKQITLEKIIFYSQIKRIIHLL